MPDNGSQTQQEEAWNGAMGEYWVARQERLDRMMAPVAQAAMAVAMPVAGERVLDVGCGCGATTLMLAEAVGEHGHATGADLSAPMLGRAAARSIGLRNIDWVRANAENHVFPAGSFDLLFSRFGVMFFADPMAAFGNLRLALKPGGRVVFACWRGFAENQWMHLPFQAVLPLVPPPPRPGPDDPGPFAFADRGRVERILTGAGFAPPTFTPFDMGIDLADGEGLETAVRQAMEVGATRRLLANEPDSIQAAAAEAIGTALRPHLDGGAVSLPGAIWLVSSTVARQPVAR